MIERCDDFAAGIIAHWVGFLTLFIASIGLGWISWNERGPGYGNKIFKIMLETSP
jgi:hypothetical protein